VADQSRPIVPIQHHDQTEHLRLISIRVNAAFMKDGTEGMVAPLKHMSYTVATVPDATLWEGATIYVSDETGGAVMAFSDGTDWRRFTDRAVIS